MQKTMGLIIILLALACLTMATVSFNERSLYTQSSSYAPDHYYIQVPTHISLDLPVEPVEPDLTVANLTVNKPDSSVEILEALERISGHIQGFVKEIVILVKLAVNTGFEKLIDVF